MEDWGYKCTITPTYPQKAKITNTTHWLVKLEFELVQCTSSVAGVLVRGIPWSERVEGEVAGWMAEPIIR